MKPLNSFSTARALWALIDQYKWHLNSKVGELPSLEKQKMIKKYAKRYNIKVLVETGTYYGDMVYATKQLFDEVYSIELSDLLYEKAIKRFSKYPNIHIIQGDSSQVLPNLIVSIKQPCLFWLDAHYSGGVTAKAIEETPINEEIRYILNHPTKGHIILIDDANLFVGKNGYPTIREVQETVSKVQPDWLCGVNSGIIKIHEPL